MKKERLISLFLLLFWGLTTLSAQEIAEDDLIGNDPSLANPRIETMDNTKLTAESQTTDTVRIQPFNPDPNKALWYSVLCPGLGQIYNRSYWKLPIVVGGFMGLAYGMSWNNRYLEDYTFAYLDIMDSDPTTTSYMDFLPPNTKESNVDKNWLKGVLKRKKDYFRRNRDLCIISMIGVYAICIIDAYVDAHLFHFDISPDLAMDIVPTITPATQGIAPSAGIAWAINF